MKQLDLAEIRRRNLLYLIEQYGTMAKLNEVLGRDRHDSALAQIKNQSFNKSKNVTRKMGVALARSIEQKLNLPMGWMDQAHDEKQSVILGNTITTSSVKLLTLPLYEFTNKEKSGKGFVPKLKGEIHMPLSFFAGVVENMDGTKMFYVHDNNMPLTAPAGSIVLVNCNVREVKRDGLYLIKAEDKVFLRKISSSAFGGFTVASDINGNESVPSLENIEILGMVVCVWACKLY